MGLYIGLLSGELKTTSLKFVIVLNLGMRSSTRLPCQNLWKMSVGCPHLFQHTGILLPYFKWNILCNVSIYG